MEVLDHWMVETQTQKLTAFNYLTLAVGCMIGVGWIAVVGEWLTRAGPAGSLLGFLVGGAIMAGIAMCYAELAALMPLSGGDVVFATRAFGPGAGFLVGWFLLLAYVSIIAFEAVSL